MSKQYIKGATLNVKGKKVQIISVNADGTATYSNVKKDGTLEQGIAGNLPAINSIPKPVSAAAAAAAKLDANESVTGYASVSVADYHAHAEDIPAVELAFINLAGFKRFIQDNVGTAKLKLVEAPPITIKGNLGDTVVEHKALGLTRTVDKVSSSGFYLDGVMVDWGKADEWKFHGNQVIWTGDDGYFLAYEIV